MAEVEDVASEAPSEVASEVASEAPSELPSEAGSVSTAATVASTATTASAAPTVDEDQTKTATAEGEEREGSEGKENEKAPSANPLEDLSDADLVKTVEDLRLTMICMKMENYMFEKFLNTNDKGLIEGMENVLNNARQMQKKGPGEKSVTFDTASLLSTGTSSTLEGSNILMQDKVTGPRINLNQKNDLIVREMEEIQLTLNKFIRKAHRTKCNLRAELEEMDTRISEIEQATEIFEQSVIIEGIDPLTQRIPAERFVRYMHEWFKSSQTVVQKLRLHISTLGIQVRKVSNLLAHKKELGESLHSVDFEKLQIENRHYQEEIDVKTNHLLDLKRMNGKANLSLNNNKKYLQRQLKDMKKTQLAIDQKKKQIDELEQSCYDAEDDLEKAKSHLNTIKKMAKTYEVPEVMEYVKLKAELYELKRNVKVWTRRCNIQNVALNASIREMKIITGSKRVQESWFRDEFDIESNQGDADLNLDENMELELEE